GSEISDSSEIRKYAAGFYKDLYRSEWSSNPGMQDSFLRGLPQVGEDTNAGLAAESVFKVWGTLLKKRQEQADSAYWLQQEPVLWGTKLDMPNQMKETITRRMRTTRIANLGQVVVLTGPRMDDPSGLAAQLGLTSVRIITKLLDHWRSRLSPSDRLLLTSPTTTVGEEEPFPAIALAPDFKDCNGPLLKNTSFIPLQETTGKTFYRMMVKTLNKQRLNQRADTPWRGHLHLAPDCRPQWRALYKPPLSKRHADLHWRLLHGIFPVNSFVSTINQTVEDKCPFCDQRETIFHCFYECQRLLPLFSFLRNVFFKCEEFFMKQSFILGFKYTRHQKDKCQLLNFVLGQAKMAVYLSRKRKMEEGFIVEPVVFCTNMIKSRLLIDFNFQKTAGDLHSFIQ
ncbi:unnamed protein product, partial [Tetraodon nigroviridis]